MSPHGLSLRARTVQIHYEWSAVKRVVEIDKYVLIYLDRRGGSFCYLPKRELTEVDLIKIKDLLRTYPQEGQDCKRI